MAEARIVQLSGPLLRARAEGRFRLYEAVQVGPDRLLGEVTRLEGDQITVQVYEDATGLAPGAPVYGTEQLLSVALGPGLLGGIFDGLLKPLEGQSGAFVSHGARERRPQRFRLRGAASVGSALAGGQVLASMEGPLTAEEDRSDRQALQLLVPPGLDGRLTYLADGQILHEDEVAARVQREDGSQVELSLLQSWPVRLPRPSGRRLPLDRPLVTGQRVVDSLFPVALGGRAAVPGGFGTGKTILLETLAKWCSAEVIVYVGCGERGNELTGMLEEFPRLTDPRTGRRLMERTVIIANTSNMPVAAREASIYTGVTVAEYFRDQGLHVALMADSTSRWAEALREISGRLGEIPGEGGYPAYLASRLADFYERAARVETLAGAEGSVTLLGTVSPPAGDFSEPVTSHTKRYVRCLWALDSKRAQARMYPAINPLQSYSQELDSLEAWWKAHGNAEWLALRRTLLALLEDEVRLQRMARIIGKDALPPAQGVRLLCAELANDAFLRQSAFSEPDRYASPERQAVMLKLLVHFTQAAESAVAAAVPLARIASLPVLRNLLRMGEDLGEQRVKDYAQLFAQIDHAFAELRGKEAVA